MNYFFYAKKGENFFISPGMKNGKRPLNKSSISGGFLFLELKRDYNAILEGWRNFIIDFDRTIFTIPQ